MPRRDGTGPMGQGQMTGRGLGPCSGTNANIGYGRGLGLCPRRNANVGFGRGYARGGGGMGFFAAQPIQDKQWLENQKAMLEVRLHEIEKQLGKD